MGKISSTTWTFPCIRCNISIYININIRIYAICVCYIINDNSLSNSIWHWLIRLKFMTIFTERTIAIRPKMHPELKHTCFCSWTWIVLRLFVMCHNMLESVGNFSSNANFCFSMSYRLPDTTTIYIYYIFRKSIQCISISHGDCNSSDARINCVVFHLSAEVFDQNMPFVGTYLHSQIRELTM